MEKFISFYFYILIMVDNVLDVEMDYVYLREEDLPVDWIVKENSEDKFVLTHLLSLAEIRVVGVGSLDELRFNVYDKEGVSCDIDRESFEVLEEEGSIIIPVKFKSSAFRDVLVKYMWEISEFDFRSGGFSDFNDGILEEEYLEDEGVVTVF